jgi:hypothetical protein
MFRAQSCNVQSSSQAYGQQKSNNSTGGTIPAERAKVARERALQIKRAQGQALVSLPQRHLYIILWIRRDPPITNDFHWGFYYHKNASGGTKYHMRNVGGGWLPDHGPTGGVFKSNFLCVLVQIASIPADEEQRLDQLMRTYDSNVNSIPGVTCRVWLFRILEVLVQGGLVRCADLQALEAECMDCGNQHMSSAANNTQPRPVVASRLCT